MSLDVLLEVAEDVSGNGQERGWYSGIGTSNCGIVLLIGVAGGAGGAGGSPGGDVASICKSLMSS